MGTNDGIANYLTMKRRSEELNARGIASEIDIYEGLGHGFGLGIGTVAEAWFDEAVEFCQQQMR